jgi:hypothetical protein
MPASWRDACRLTGREGEVSKQRDREQPLWRQGGVIYNEPGRRAGTRGDGGDPSPGVLRSGCRGWGGFVYNTTCLWRGQSKAKPQARRNEHRKFLPVLHDTPPKRSETNLALPCLRRSSEMNRAFSVRLDGRALRVFRRQSANFNTQRSGEPEPVRAVLRLAVWRRSYGARGRALPSLRCGWSGMERSRVSGGSDLQFTILQPQQTAVSGMEWSATAE